MLDGQHFFREVSRHSLFCETVSPGLQRQKVKEAAQKDLPGTRPKLVDSSISTGSGLCSSYHCLNWRNCLVARTTLVGYLCHGALTLS